MSIIEVILIKGRNRIMNTFRKFKLYKIKLLNKIGN